MTTDTGIRAVEELAPALGVVANKHRLHILQVLGAGPVGPGDIARHIGLSRRTVDRHLAALEACGLVRPIAGSRNGRLYELDRQKATILNASFVSLIGRAGVGDSPAPAEITAGADEPLPMAVPNPPQPCMHCGSGGFVREVLNDLDRSLVKAREFQARLRQISGQVLTAQEEERKRIARELHDDTAQALTSVLVRLRLLERFAENGQIQAGLSELRELTVDTLQGVRRMAVDLRPPMLDDLGLEAALQAHVQDFARHWPVRASFACGRLGRLPQDVELVLYRIVQEALSNVAKHADASSVDVRLSRSRGMLRLTVEDDGRGFDVDATKGSRESGLGLFGMDERLALVGGSLRVESVPGRGARVSADVPLPRNRPI